MRKLYTSVLRERHQQSFSKEIPQYHLEVKPNGAKVLVEDKLKVNIYDRIQSAAVGTDVKEVIKRYALTGDASQLQKVQGIYGDFTAVTGSLIQMQAQLDNAKAYFESQSLDFRKEYDNDVMKFLAALDNGELKEKPQEATVTAATTAPAAAQPAATAPAAAQPAATAPAVEGVKYE